MGVVSNSFPPEFSKSVVNLYFLQADVCELCFKTAHNFIGFYASPSNKVVSYLLCNQSSVVVVNKLEGVRYRQRVYATVFNVHG